MITQQILRSATSVGANYLAACRAWSQAEYLAKLGVVEEEADECCYWIELLIESELVEKDLLDDLYRESNEITAMIVASIKTAKT